MFDSVQIFLPFFCLVGLGWAAVHIQLLTPTGIQALNTFVLFFGLPAMVFLLAAQGALAAHTLGPMLLAYGVGGTVLLLLACAVYAKAGMTRPHAGLLALATVFPNTGFLGLPLLTALLGTTAAGVVMATLLVDVLWLSSLGLVWASSSTTGHKYAGSQLAQSLYGALRNPLLWAMAAGLAWHGTSWHLPMALDKTLGLLGMAASPTALFALGGVLHKRGRTLPISPDVSGAAWIHPAGVVMKLVAHPALVWVTGTLLQRYGWPLAPDTLVALTMAAALPSASNVLLLAERRQADAARVGQLIWWTTLLAMPTMLLWASLVG